MIKNELLKLVYTKSMLRGNFLLSSGAYSKQYFDKYLFESEPYILRAITAALIPILPPLSETFKLAGLEMGGIPIATSLSLMFNLDCLFVRKKAKEHGTCNVIEGLYQISDQVVIIEDVVTSGSAVLKAIDDLRSVGLIVQRVVCVIDRESTGRKAIEEKGCSFSSLFTRSELNSMRK